MQQYERFLPANFRSLSVDERTAARKKAYADFLAHREARKSEIAAEKAAAAAKAMTCQICGRTIFAEQGLIAHHGYQRPYEGVQTASCEGARQMPFEVGKDRLLQHIEHIARLIEDLQTHIGRIEREERAVSFTWTSKERALTRSRFSHDYVTRISQVTRENFDAVLAVIKAEARFHPSIYSFDVLKENELRKLNMRLDGMKRYRADQTQRANAWKQTHRVGHPGEGQWVAL